ncbi:AMED_5909 family protein [Actinophytocola sp.]|uniref:AMED_5909 family protein n=1 Tax=Actinophytocola sp. TaxID=1872138 RepID=UPI003D6A3C9A
MSGARRADPTRLMQAHELLSRERPAVEAKPETWLAYYRRSAAVYAEVAEIDRGHHHEALYWSSREKRKAREIEDGLRGSKGGANRDA